MTVTSSTLLVRGARLRPDGPPVSILVQDGRIAALGADADHRVPSGSRILDAGGLLAAPGLIDLQVNGAGGIDLTSDPSGIWAVGTRLAPFGVTAFLPTIISSPPDVVEEARRVLAAGPPSGHVGALPLGLHLEGPFIARGRRGVHDPDLVAPPDPSRASGWSASTGVRIVTLAPELPGALDLVRALSSRGVVVAAGHSAAEWDEARAGVDAGIRYATHLWNAMPPIDHRRPGLVPALLQDERVTVGLIADGIHLHPATVEVSWRLSGPDRFSLVTDSTAALGMPPGRYRLGSREVESDGRTVRFDGRLAGGVCSLDEALRNLVAFTGASSEDVLGTVTHVPARLLGLDGERGRLIPGAVGDVVLFTDSLEVAATVVRGEIVADRQGFHG